MKRLFAAAVLLAAAAVAAADGKATFGGKCAACHGADGKGQTAMGKKLGVKDLTVTKLTAAEMEAVITSGRGKMTPFGAKLGAAEIKEVAAFVKGGLK
jgi:mono/diheme cytochrome c family protein